MCILRAVVGLDKGTKPQCSTRIPFSINEAPPLTSRLFLWTQHQAFGRPEGTILRLQCLHHRDELLLLRLHISCESPEFVRVVKPGSL